MVDGHDEWEFGHEPEPAPDNVIPFPRMRPSTKLAERWASELKNLDRKQQLLSPLGALPSLIRKRSMPAMPWPAAWPDITARCRTYVGQCIGVTGPIGGGKTSFALQVAIAAAGCGMPTNWAALELDPEEVDLRFVANMHGVHMSSVREQWTEDQLTHSLTPIDDMVHYVDHLDDPEEQFAAIEDAIMVAWKIYQVPPLTVVDHLGELVAEERDDRAALRRWAHRFRKLALKTNSYIMLLNQVSKGNQAATTGKLELDAASDALGIEMGSQAIASACANSLVLLVFKQDDTQVLDSHVLTAKARNTGKEGRTGFKFHKPGGVWEETDYLPPTPGQARAEADKDKKDKHRITPPRTSAQAREDMNKALEGDAAASRRIAIMDALTRHGALGMEMAEIRKIRGAGKTSALTQALQELKLAGAAEPIGTKWRAVVRNE